MKLRLAQFVERSSARNNPCLASAGATELNAVILFAVIWSGHSEHKPSLLGVSARVW